MKKLLALILALVMCIGLFAGCNQTADPTDAPTDAPTNPPETDAPTMPPTAETDDSTAKANEEGWLKIGSLNEKFQYNNSDYGGLIKNFMWSRLLMINGEGTVIGTDLAESYEVSEDGLTWTIKIKDNAKWHDGTDLTADDFKFTVEVIAKGAQVNSVFAGALASIDGYAECKAGEADEIVGIVADGKNLTIKCDTACSTMGLTLGQMNVNPKHLLGDEDPLTIHDASYWIKPVGSGFYKIGEYVEGKYWKLVPNEDFYDADRIPQIQQLYLGYSSGGTTSDAVLSAQSGDIHYSTTMSPDEVTEISKLDNYALVPVDIYYVRYLMWNAYGQKGNQDTTSPINDVRIRRAMMHAIDRAAICDEMFLGYASLLQTKVPSSFSYFAEDAYVYDYDPEKAKALCAEAGFDMSTPLKLACYYSDQQSKDVVEALVYYLNDAGFNFELVYITGDLVQGIYETKDYDVCYAGLSAMGPEEAYGAYCNLTPEMLMGKVRPIISAADGNKFEELYNELLVTVDADRRVELLKELQKAEYDYLWDLPLFAVQQNIIIRTDILSVGTNAGGNEWFNYDRDVETWSLLKIEDPTA